MYCMKCGKEIAEKQAFCDSCLAVMARFPVKPDTHVSLPNRAAPIAAKKTANRKNLSVTERFARMKKAIQWLSIVLAVTVFALFLSITLLINTIASKPSNNTIGQNYNTADTFSNTD